MKTPLPRLLNAADLRSQTIDHAETMPADWYADPEFDRFDKGTILHQTWQYLGPATRVAKTGDFMVEDIAGVPVIVVRTSESAVSAYANVCRHRGGVLATADGHGRVLRCHYHGWSYGLDGKLVGTPQFQDKASLRPDQCQLPKFSAQEWEGMIFVNLSADPKPFADTFGGITERIAPVEICKKFHIRHEYHVEANWKLYVDNYLEGYHVPVVHPELSAIIDNDKYVYELSKMYSLQFSPIRKENNPYGTGGTAYYFWIYPNIMFNIFEGRIQVNSVMPVTPGSCKVYFDYYFDDQTSEQGRKRIADDLALSAVVQEQDREVCLAVQRGLASGTYRTGRLVPNQEMAVLHFHELVRDSYRLAT